ncbi:MAG: chromosomal replication initiator protein DnaA [Clostridia bacterium]|nr:chromosomal replication initiator protein DnaA [Oscillospiraceae bacterium]MBR4893262.1 chromosomal replication initiator protein DnaA [Clostridia bacterium]
MANITDFWDNLLDMIEEEGKQISPLGFNTWVKTIKPFDIIDNKLILSVPLDVNKEMIEKRYFTLIKSAAVILDSKISDVLIELEENLVNFKKEEKETIINIDDSFYKKSNLQKKFTFENFVIGENNRLACAAAQSVAKDPGRAYNPLFLYGDVGLGKTHLMQAVGNEILKKNKDSKILYISSEQFVNDMVDSIRDNTINEFKEKYRTLDVLMIDDIQFIGGKERCQEEFFHTFNHLILSEKQIIITSDRPPKDISKLEERLRSRFEGGLTWDIKKPDYETRFAILKKKVQNESINIDDEYIEIIAKKVKDNIREIEGVLNKLIAYSTLSNEKITKDLLNTIISDIEDSKPNKVLNMDTVIYEVCKFYDVDPKIIKSRTRKEDILIINQIIMYVMKSVLDVSLSKIGEKMGGRSHSTVLSSLTKIEEKIESDEKFKNEIEEIITNIKNLF